MTPVTLVVPVINNFEGFAELIRSIDYPVYPIIIDNWVKNRGVSWSWNYGVDNSPYNEVLIVNDDVIFEPGTISYMVSKSKEYAIFGSSAGFACFIINKNLFKLKFDEAFYPAYFEDNDIKYRAILDKLPIDTLNQNAKVWHHISKSQNKGQIVSPARFEELKQYYIKKWGGEPGHETYTIPFNSRLV